MAYRDEIYVSASNPPLSGGFTKQIWVNSVSGASFAYSTTSGGYVQSGGGAAVGSNVTQAAHGFVVGEHLYRNAGSYAKARADASATAEAVGIVSAVLDANTFTLSTGGLITGLSGLTDGTVYFLSTTVAGGVQTAQPNTPGHIDKPVMIAVSTTSAVYLNMRGVLVGGGSTLIPVAQSTAPTHANGLIWLNTSGSTVSGVPAGASALSASGTWRVLSFRSSFSAYVNSNINANNLTWTTASVMTAFQTDAGFNAATATYTAPCTGQYIFQASVNFQDPTDANFWGARFIVNGLPVTGSADPFAVETRQAYTSTNTSGSGIALSLPLYLTAGDTVNLQGIHSRGTGQFFRHGTTWFAGVFVG